MKGNVQVDSLFRWLDNYKVICDGLIEVTTCAKWKRWARINSEQILPCVCSEREKECASVELYYRIWSVGQMLNNEQNCIEAILDYDEIKAGKGAADLWLKRYRSVFDDLVLLEEKFSVTYKKHPEEGIEVLLPKDEIKHLIYFKELYFDAMQ